jgi:hypothetical protein
MPKNKAVALSQRKIKPLTDLEKSGEQQQKFSSVVVLANKQKPQNK